MPRYYNDRGGGWAPYVSVAARRRKAARAMQTIREEGCTIAPVVVQGRLIARTFWGKAWCQNLESYRDYENRLPRGRSYLRNGSVIDLQIAPTEVTAMVSGSSIYSVRITIGGVGKGQWTSICRDCSGGIDSLVELLQGRFSNAVMERICRQGSGLFPKPAEIRFSCSCPDYASLCKHVAAVLYGVGARLDEQPELLFRLRAVDEKDLVAHVDALPAGKDVTTSDKVLNDDDLSRLFDLDMDGEAGTTAMSDSAPAAQQEPLGGKKSTRSRSSARAPKVSGLSSHGSTGRSTTADRAHTKDRRSSKVKHVKRVPKSTRGKADGITRR